MFQTASGVAIPFPERIKEEFQIFENSVMLNLSFEKLKLFIDEFLEQLVEPMFLVLEIPLSKQEESELRKDDTFPFHKKVCYLDGQSKKQIKDILIKYSTLLLNDGISQFAIYSHATKDGVYIRKYKIVSIYSYNPEKYIQFLESYGLIQTDNLLTVWDTFSHETPGQVEKVRVNETDIFNVYDDLVKIGMYVASVVEG